MRPSRESFKSVPVPSLLDFSDSDGETLISDARCRLSAVDAVEQKFQNALRLNQSQSEKMRIARIHL